MKNKAINVLFYIMILFCFCPNNLYINASQEEISIDSILNAINIENFKKEYDENLLKRKEMSNQPFSYKIGKLIKYAFENIEDQIILVRLNLPSDKYYLSILVKKSNGQILNIYKKMYSYGCGEPYGDVAVNDFGFFDSQKFLILEETISYSGCIDVETSENRNITILSASDGYREVFKDDSFFWSENGDSYFNIYRPPYFNADNPLWILHHKYSKNGALLENLKIERKWDKKLKKFTKGSTWDVLKRRL